MLMFPNFLRSYVVRQLVRQLIHTMCISNNCQSFILWWKKNLIKDQRVSIYYENYCLQNFLLYFISLSTAKFVKKKHSGKNLLHLPKKCPKANPISFNTKFLPQWKAWKSSYQLRQILALFFNLIALTLG